MKVRFEDKDGNRGTFEINEWGRIEILTNDEHCHIITEDEGKVRISTNPSTVFKPNGMSMTMWNISEK